MYLPFPGGGETILRIVSLLIILNHYYCQVWCFHFSRREYQQQCKNDNSVITRMTYWQGTGICPFVIHNFKTINALAGYSTIKQSLCQLVTVFCTRQYLCTSSSVIGKVLLVPGQCPVLSHVGLPWTRTNPSVQSTRRFCSVVRFVITTVIYSVYTFSLIEMTSSLWRDRAILMRELGQFIGCFASYWKMALTHGQNGCYC